MVKRRFAVAFVLMAIVLAVVGLARRRARMVGAPAMHAIDVPEPVAETRTREPIEDDADPGGDHAEASDARAEVETVVADIEVDDVDADIKVDDVNVDTDAELDIDESVAETDEAFVTLRTLEEARTMDHTAVVMQGGGNEQIYLTVPVKYVACDDATLRAMAAMLDALEWNDPARLSLSFELAPIGSGIFGGMGGGSVIDGVWIHPRFEAVAMRAPIAAVLYGRQTLDDIRTEIPRELPPQTI